MGGDTNVAKYPMQGATLSRSCQVGTERVVRHKSSLRRLCLFSVRCFGRSANGTIEYRQYAHSLDWDSSKILEENLEPIDEWHTLELDDEFRFGKGTRRICVLKI